MTKCVQCGKKRTPPKTFSYVSRRVWEADEFCTAVCCRKFHGVIERKGHTSTYYTELP